MVNILNSNILNLLIFSSNSLYSYSETIPGFSQGPHIALAAISLNMGEVRGPFWEELRGEAGEGLRREIGAR